MYYYDRLKRLGQHWDTACLCQASGIFWSQSATKIFRESDGAVMEVENGRLLPAPEGLLLLRVRLGKRK